MGEEKALVEFEFHQLEGTNLRYVQYTFAPHWRLEHLRAAMDVGRRMVAQLPVDEKLESVFLFSQTERFDSVNLIAEMRHTFSDPLNARFSYTSLIGLSRLAREFLDVIVSIGKQVYHERMQIGFYESLDEALAAMHERTKTGEQP